MESNVPINSKTPTVPAPKMGAYICAIHPFDEKIGLETGECTLILPGLKILDEQRRSHKVGHIQGG